MNTNKIISLFKKILIIGILLTAIQGWASEVNVKTYGAQGDGVSNDTIPIQNAIAAAGYYGSVYFPSGTYLVYAKLVQLPYQDWYGSGGQRATTLKKMFNGDLIDMGDLGRLANLNIDGNGAAYSGNGINVIGSNQSIERVRVTQTEGICLNFPIGNGGSSNVIDFRGVTTNPAVVPAIKLCGDSDSNPRFFSGIYLSGGLFDISGPGAGGGCSLVNFYIRNFVTGGSVLMHIANGRVASVADTTTISGGDLTFTGVAFSGPVYLENAQGMRFSGCTFHAGITENAETCSSNEFDTTIVPYSPVWTQPGGTQPVLGNGTLAGYYTRNGRLCTVSLRLVMGSTTTYGNSSCEYRFSLPFIGNSSMNQRGMSANIFDLSALLDYAATITIGVGQDSFKLSRNGQSIRGGFPIAWAAGDIIDVQFSYMVK